MSNPLSKEERSQAWGDLHETLTNASRDEDPLLYDGLQSLLATVTDLESQLAGVQKRLEQAGKLFKEYSEHMQKWVRWEQTRGKNDSL